uniref:Uncharacterized protein LOC113783973 n=1 Tax=Cicer arietinum TaxID=3827 RepID=A0A3Q7XQH8_CICAR|nr:uncharacterized protein LOC113783973 [Cicer arietinum]
MVFWWKISRGYTYGFSFETYLTCQFRNPQETIIHEGFTWGYGSSNKSAGVAALAYLYDNLREVSMHHTRTVSGLSPNYVEDYPRALRWKPKRDKGLVLSFRKALDEIDVDQGPKMYAHLPNRVLRQYGHVQIIPDSPLEIVSQTTTLDEIDIIFTQYAVHIMDGSAVVQGPVDGSNNLMDCFRIISHPYIILREPVDEDPSVVEPAANAAYEAVDITV